MLRDQAIDRRRERENPPPCPADWKPLTGRECQRCHEVKPATEFTVRRRWANGAPRTLCSACKPCEVERVGERRVDPARRAERQQYLREYAERNASREAARKRRWAADRRRAELEAAETKVDRVVARLEGKGATVERHRLRSGRTARLTVTMPGQEPTTLVLAGRGRGKALPTAPAQS